MKPLHYGRQDINDDDLAAVTEVLKGDFLTQGPWVKRFEDAFAAFVKAPYALAVGTGTAALQLSVAALGIRPGQKVIVTPLTFCASANSVRYADGEVVFCDIDPSTGNLDPRAVGELLSQAQSGEYAGIITVDFAGMPSALPELRALADAHGLWLLEDACHAPGGFTADGEPCGSGKYADAAVFSFHPVKHLTTGEGGMVTTARPDIAERISVLRTHGIVRDSAKFKRRPDGPWYHEMQELGWNHRLPDTACALGLSQLKRLGAFLERRRWIAARYDEAFRDASSLPFTPGAHAKGHAHHLYVVLNDRRDELMEHLKKEGIHPQVHYIPTHLMPYYLERYAGAYEGRLPQAEAYYRRCLSLPMYPAMTDADVDRVIRSVRSF